MSNLRRRITAAIGVLVLIAVSSVLVSSCKSDSNTEPAYNPPAAAAAPITVAGNVVNAETNAGLVGATVEIYKPDGSKVATITSGAAGAFSYDVSNVRSTSLKVTAKATGFGFGFTTSKVDTAKKTAQVVAIPLDPVATVQATITPSGGTVTSPTVTESKANQPLTMTIPAGAVAQNTSVQMAAIPVNNVTPPANANASAQVGVANLTPAGVTFSAPVTLSFPLPYKFKANDEIAISEFVNGAWQNTSLKAVVNSTGYVATVNVTKTSQYALVDNTTFAGNVALGKSGSVLEERSFTFSQGILNAELPGSITFTRNSTNVVTEVPTDEWIFNNLAQRYGVVFAKVDAPGTTPSTIKFNVSWPGPAANPNKQNADGSGNKNRPGESGSWSRKVVFESYSEQFANVSLDNPGYCKVTVSGTAVYWREKQRIWVWTPHNQGGVFEY